MIKNYLASGTKGYKVIELLNAGKTRNEVAKAMKYKSKSPISSVLSRNKLKERDALAKAIIRNPKGALNEKEDLNIEVNNPADVNVSPTNPVSPLVVPPRVGDPQGSVVQIEGFAPGKQVFLTANNILMYQWFAAKYNYEGDLSDFLNDAVEDFFRARNWRIKIVKEEFV